MTRTDKAQVGLIILNYGAVTSVQKTYAKLVNLWNALTTVKKLHSIQLQMAF